MIKFLTNNWWIVLWSTLFNSFWLLTPASSGSRGPPPTPPPTYLWEEVRRSKSRGGYPWTILYKPPLPDYLDIELLLKGWVANSGLCKQSILTTYHKVHSRKLVSINVIFLLGRYRMKDSWTRNSEGVQLTELTRDHKFVIDYEIERGVGEQKVSPHPVYQAPVPFRYQLRWIKPWLSIPQCNPMS